MVYSACLCGQPLVVHIPLAQSLGLAGAGGLGHRWCECPGARPSRWCECPGAPVVRMPRGPALSIHCTPLSPSRLRPSRLRRIQQSPPAHTLGDHGTDCVTQPPAPGPRASSLSFLLLYYLLLLPPTTWLLVNPHAASLRGRRTDWPAATAADPEKIRKTS